VCSYVAFSGVRARGLLSRASKDSKHVTIDRPGEASGTTYGESLMAGQFELDCVRHGYCKPRDRT
jgi:hypothetical protein